AELSSITPVTEIVEVTTPEQIERVRWLIRAYQSQLPERYCFPNDGWLNLPGAYAPPQGALLLATIAGEPAGCVGLRSFPQAGACEMKRLYVRPTFRGHKLGNTLVEQIIQVARRLGYSRLRLDTHPDTMQAAVELYRRFGFEEVVDNPLPLVPGLSYMELRL
ncbi:MAG TPA: GNAT family N-acetyltransferase, partial [Terriglobales bacterium]